MNADFTITTSSSLIERSIAGDREAWAVLSDVYAPMVYAWVRHCGLQPSDARDLTQDTFAKVFGSISKFERDKGKFRGWLWQLSRNLVRDFLKDQKRLHDTVDPSELDQIEHGPWDDVESELPPMPIVERALRYLEHDFDERTRILVREVIMEGRKPRDVAQELNMTENAVYVVRSRAVKKLKRLLSDVESPKKGDENV